MVQIIKNNMDSLRWSKELQCTFCESIIRIDLLDVNVCKRSYDDRPDYVSFYIKCPVCEEEIKVSEEDLPTDVERRQKLLKEFNAKRPWPNSSD